MVDGCAICQSPEKENLDCLENHIKSLLMGSRFHEEASRKGKKETKLGGGMCSAEVTEMRNPSCGGFTVMSMKRS
jgi:hypothetical protein